MENDLDKKLYNDYLNGNKEAFEILYNKYKNKIEYFIYNIVKDYQKAEDLTQETFIYVMQNKIKENYSFKTYIYLKAKYLSLNYIKTENLRNEIAEKYLYNKDERIEKDVLEIISKEESKKELLESIELLGEKYKNAIYLIKIEELSYEEVSKILGETLQNTQKLVHRGKMQLRNILIKKGFDEMNKLSKIIIGILIATTVVSGAVYAITNIKISGKPVFKWFNINFSDEYEKYKEEVQDEIIQAPSESSIELVSTICDEGFTILEFDLKLSEQDKKYLKIGKPILTEEYINATDDIDSNMYESVLNEKTGEIERKIKKQVILEKYAGKTISDSIRVSYNLKPGWSENVKYVYRLTNRFAIIDGEYYFIKIAPQSITQVSEYEYKIYQMYFLTDKELGDKTEFTLTMKDWVITTEERQTNDLDTYLEIDGEFNIDLSKEKAVQNSKKIQVSCNDVIYENKNLTQTIESVVVTPLQTIVKVHSIYDNVNKEKLTDANNTEYIGPRAYKIFNANGEEINSFSSESKRKITYTDGKEEEWATGQIEPTRGTFENASLEVTDIILIENSIDNSSIKIVSQDGNEIKNIEYTNIGSFEIDLTKEQ